MFILFYFLILFEIDFDYIDYDITKDKIGTTKHCNTQPESNGAGHVHHSKTEFIYFC